MMESSSGHPLHAAAEQLDLLTPPPPEVLGQLQEYASKIKSEKRKRRSTRSSLFGAKLLMFIAEFQLSLEFDDVTKKGEKECLEDKYEWSTGDVIHLHFAVLKHLLHLLKDTRVRRNTREELVDWLAFPLVTPTQIANKRPFSFQACCNAVGLRADILQIETFRILGLTDLIKEMDPIQLNAIEDAVWMMQYASH